MFGTRMFNISYQSRNNWSVGLLAGGEGWHNNHHTFPQSAFHGLRWWQIDLSGHLIRLFEWLGLAKDVQRVPREVVINRDDPVKVLQAEAAQLRQQVAGIIDNAIKDFSLQKNRLKKMHQAKKAALAEVYASSLASLKDVQQRFKTEVDAKKESLEAYLREVHQLIAQVHVAEKRKIHTRFIESL